MKVFWGTKPSSRPKGTCSLTDQYATNYVESYAIRILRIILSNALLHQRDGEHSCQEAARHNDHTASHKQVGSTVLISKQLDHRERQGKSAHMELIPGPHPGDKPAGSTYLRLTQSDVVQELALRGADASGVLQSPSFT